MHAGNAPPRGLQVSARRVVHTNDETGAAHGLDPTGQQVLLAWRERTKAVTRGQPCRRLAAGAGLGHRE